MNHSAWTKRLVRSLQQNSPAILTGLAVTGVGLTVVLAVKATPKALEDLALEKEDAGKENLPVKTVIRTTWRPYLPSAVAGTATIACIIGAHRIGVRRQAALLGAYTLVDTAFRNYKDEVLAQIGEAKERKITDAVAQKKMDGDPLPANSQVIVIGGSDTLCYDMLTGRYFKCDVESIRRAEVEINRRVVRDMYAPQNEFYDLVGLPRIDIGDEVGWNLEHIMEIIFTAHLNDCGQPCLAVGYRYPPVPGYGKIY